MKRIIILLMIVWSTQTSAYNEMDLQRFNALKRCPSCDLSGLNLFLAVVWDTDLRRANLRGASIRFSTFVGGTLAGADLTGADLTGTRFGTVEMYVDLSHADLTDAIINNTDFQYANFCNTKTPWGIENIECK